MSQVILPNNSERIAPIGGGNDVDHRDFEPVGTDVDFPDVLADLDLETVPDEVAEYGRVRLGETEESRTQLLAELEDMIYGKRLHGGSDHSLPWSQINIHLNFKLNRSNPTCSRYGY